jgi:peptidoglycan hydrolase CwlO-like protein
MARNDEFLVNLGNAMRGSLLAGKAYPTATPAAPTQTDERLDKVLHALNTLQGQLQDLSMSIEEIRKKAERGRDTKRRPESSSRTRKARA